MQLTTSYTLVTDTYILFFRKDFQYKPSNKVVLYSDALPMEHARTRYHLQKLFFFFRMQPHLKLSIFFLDLKNPIL